MVSFEKHTRFAAGVVCATILLSVAAYWWAVGLPLISDDYLQIHLGREYGPAGSWGALAADALYRCRATSILLTHWTERVFGATTFAFNLSGLLLHIVCCWLVFALGVWKKIGWRVSGVAACFFAVYLGHQEAVVWYSALPELLVFLFGVATVLSWILRSERPKHATGFYFAALTSFVLALISKESAVAVVGLMAMVSLVQRESWKRAACALAPFVLLSIGYFALAYATRETHHHFSDGTFSLTAPFWIVMPRSILRMLWVWGLASCVLLAVWRAREWRPVVFLSFGWMAIGLAPYSFLTYMPHVPSRHTYLASAGLALLVAAGFLAAVARARRRLVAAVALATVICVHHCGYLWLKKQPQFLERAQPTERLLRAAEGKSGPLLVRCFPYPEELAQLAVDVRLGNEVRLVLVGQDQPAGNAPVVDLCESRF